MFSNDFPKAIAVERGCGEREPGGVYVECGLSPFGLPLEYFLIDPPQALPDGLDLINKPQLWTRVDPQTGSAVLDAETNEPIVDLLIWIGQEHYEYCCDYIEEVEKFGASRRINPNLDLARLTTRSRMLLAHPRALNTLWQEQTLPEICKKHLPWHDLTTALLQKAGLREGSAEEGGGEEEGEMHTPLAQYRAGPCLFKLWELMPQEAARETIALAGERPLCLREIGSTVYSYRPTGERLDGLVPGIFAALPITGFALIQYDDGSVNEKAKAKLLHAPLPHYETDR